MNKSIKTIWLINALLVVSVFNLNAQSFFDRVTTRSGDKKKVPTVITSDAMDFDITKNVAVFTGNVQVDDANMRILCHKMIIRFEGEAKDIKKLADGDKKKTDDKEEKGTKEKKSKGGTKVKEIECIKNVIIIRKLYDEKEKEQGEQKALAGHAIYEVKTGKITLTDNPALIRNKDTLRGETIIYWVDSERVAVRSGRSNTSELKIRSNQKKNKGD